MAALGTALWVAGRPGSLDFGGSALEGSPPLATVAGYTQDTFRRLLRTATSVDGRKLEPMGWIRNVDFTDQEIDDLYAFLRAHHGLDMRQER